MTQNIRPWTALWSLIFGFFMILVDATIVTVAIPTVARDLDASLTAVIWVTSAYLLAYAVPLLITGRLGDRFGPRRLYLIGLTVFTLASLWCGLSGSIEMLIVARVVQGLGASIMTPQTMAVITRLFPPDRRGAAMGLWGATAGVASLVGPLLGGVLVDGLGWEWIFFVNVPVGILGFILAIVNVPVLETHRHRFDYPGVVLSAVGMFLLVFGIQEGENYDWGTIAGPVSVWSLIIAGIIVLALFIAWQAWLGRGPQLAAHSERGRSAAEVRSGALSSAPASGAGVASEPAAGASAADGPAASARPTGSAKPRIQPLLPLVLFRDHNFALANIAVTTVGFTITSLMLPLMLWTQNVHGFTPTQSALLMAPTAVISSALAPVVGRMLGRWSARWVASSGLLMFAAGTGLYGVQIAADAAWPWLLIPAVVLGFANACTWGPLSVSATRNLPPLLAGAGSGVYNTTRQVGAVLGSAAIAAIMEARIVANFPPETQGHSGSGGGGVLPDFLHAPYATAMGQSEYLPAAVIACGAVAAVFLRSSRREERRAEKRVGESQRS